MHKYKTEILILNWT